MGALRLPWCRDFHPLRCEGLDQLRLPPQSLGQRATRFTPRALCAPGGFQGPQRAHNKVQRLLDKADKLTDELDAERKLKSGPYAFGWSEKTGALVVRPWKRQLWVRDWWRKARRWGYPRPRGTYDDAAAKRRVQAAMAAEVAACVESLVADVVSACSAPVARPKGASPRKTRRMRARASSG